MPGDVCRFKYCAHCNRKKSRSPVNVSMLFLVRFFWQATIQGFVSRGFSTEQAEDLLSRSVALVVEARDQFWEECQRQAVSLPGGVLQPHDGKRARHKPLAAASIGSYGAYLADGSEYR